ncbi:MAG: hypothetical protein ACRD6B_25445 [Bryobacteraceae bacterium]
MNRKLFVFVRRSAPPVLLMGAWRAPLALAQNQFIRALGHPK